MHCKTWRFSASVANLFEVTQSRANYYCCGGPSMTQCLSWNSKISPNLRLLLLSLPESYSVVSLQKWVLLVFSFIAGLLAVASTLGLITSVVTAIVHKGRSLLTHCILLKHGIGSSSVTYECPFDPTRIYVRTKTEVKRQCPTKSSTQSCFSSIRAPQSFCGCRLSWCLWWKWCSPSAASLPVRHSCTSVRAGGGPPSQRG